MERSLRIFLMASILMGMVLPSMLTPVQAQTTAADAAVTMVSDPGNIALPDDPQSSAQFRPLFVPLPVVTIGTGSVMLGADFTITATFDNNGDTGYGPFIDLYIPHVGPDGIFPDEPNYDGISPASGSNYTATTDTGEVLTVVTQTFPDDGAGTGCVDHPWGLDDVGFFLQVCGNAGDQLVSVKIPYGSFTSNQPPVTISIPAHLSTNADLGDALTVRGRAGFQYGRTPMVDWCCTTPTDTTLVSDSGTPPTWTPFSDVIPTVVTMSKSTSDTTIPTGANNPASYTITVDVADGQAFKDIDITDDLPDSIVYLGGLTSSPAATTISQPTVDGLPHSGDQIELHYDGPITSDITISFNYYIPEFDALGVSTANLTSVNTATLDTITWDPSDGSPDVILTSADIGPGSSTSNDRTITLGKGSSISIDTGTSGATPGDVVAYTLTFEISDYFGFANISIEDVLPDGQHYYTDGTHSPSLRIVRDGGTENYSFGAGNVDVACNYSGTQGAECDSSDPAADDGGTTITFDVAQELTDQSVSDQVLGDHVVDGNGIAGATTTGTVIFYATIEDSYTDTYPGESVRMGDSLSDTASISGNWVDPATCDTIANPGVCDITATVNGQTSNASVTIGRGDVEKTIVARNGTVCNSFNPCTDVKVSAGDTITYRIKYDLLTGDFSDLSLTDFLPLPIFYAQDPDVDGSTLVTWPKYVGAELVPDAGTWMLGPGDTRAIDPSSILISPSTADNSVKFGFGSYDDPANLASSIDLLFTVRVTSEKFGDGLRMRNSVLQQDSNSPGTYSTENEFIDLTLTEPILVGNKTVVSTDHVGITPSPAIAAPIVFNQPGLAVPPWNTASPLNSVYLAANPLGSGINDIDGGDLVKFAIVIENQGSGLNGAFDITLRDILPSGYQIPVPPIGLGGFNLQVYRGDGTPLDDGTGSSLEYMGTSGTVADFFDQGVRIGDPVVLPADPEYGMGACQAHDTTNGKNVILVTYDLMVRPDVAPGQLLANKGEVTHYSGSEGGDNYVEEPIVDGADSEIASPILAKTLVGTEFDNSATTNTNNNTQAVIGELVYYKLTLTLPEGSSSETEIVDTLDSGLAFVSQDAVTNSDPANITVGGSTTPVISNNGQTITWSLGTVTNTANTNSTSETLEFEYTAVVLNDSGNQSSTPLTNSAEMSWSTEDADGNPVTGSEGPISAADVTVIEPLVSVDKTVSPTTTDAGNTVEYTIVLTHPVGSETDAFDVILSDALPLCSSGGASSLNISDPLTAIAVTDTASLVDETYFELTGSNAAGWTLQTPAGTSFDMPRSTTRHIDIKVSGTLAYCVSPSRVYPNTAAIQWSSLDGEIDNRSAENAASNERRGSGVGPDDYNASSAINVTVTNVVVNKYLILTSEAHTVNPVSPFTAETRVAIGEIVRYRLVVRMPEGTSNNFQIVDTLPPGLVFLDDNTAKAAFVSTSGITSSGYGTMPIPAVTNAACQIVGSSANGGTPVAIPAACPPLASDNVSANGSSTTPYVGTYGSGADPYFKLGNLVNDDNDADAEYVIVEFNALVDNFGGANSNDITETRNNNFRAYQNNASGTLASVGLNSNNVTSRIMEPSITDLTKTANPTSGQAGDTITYTLVFSNANAAYNTTAFDVHVTDTVPPEMTANLGAMTVVSSPAACATGVDASASSGNAVDITIDTVPTGCQVTVTYDAEIQYVITANEELDNIADLTYTSLPGTNGTTGNATGSNTPGASGSNTGERDGVTVGAQNDYNDTDDASVTAPNLTVIKSIVDTSDAATIGSDLTIGETVRYRLATTLPQGTFVATTIMDTLPAGFTYAGNPKLSFIADQDVTEAVDLAGADNDALPPTFDIPAGRISVVGQLVTITLDDITNNDLSTDSDDEFVVVEFDVLVSDDVTNANAALKDNDYTMTVTGATATSTPVQATIVEPIITTTKSVTPTTGVESGDTLTYTVRATNTGTSPAYDITAEDTLAQGVTFGALTPANQCTFFNGTSSTLVAATASVVGNVVTFHSNPVGSGDIPVTATPSYYECVYTATAQNSLYLDGDHVNTIDADWYSQDAGGGRYYDDSVNRPGVDGTQDTDTATFTVDAPTIAKDDGGVTQVVVGNNITFTLTIGGPTGTLRAAVVTDHLPAGLIYNNDAVITGLPTVSPTVSSPNDGSAAVTLTWTFGDTVKSAANATIVYSARVADVTSNAIGTVLTNNVWLDHHYADDSGAPRLTSSATSTVVEPIITTTKAVVPTTGVQSGGSLTYTVRFTNTGNAPAFDVSAQDTLAQGVAFGALSPANQCTYFNGTTSTPIAATASVAGSVVTFSNAAGAWDIPVTATRSYIQCVYTATAQNTLYLNGGHTNTIDADWYSLNGGTGRNYNDSVSRPGVDGTQDTATATFTVAAPTIAKDDGGVTQVVVGNNITFTLTIGGPTGTIRSAVVTDHLPAGLIYNNDVVITGLPTVAPTVSSPNDGSAAVTLTWTFGDTVKSAANATIVYSARVADVTSNAIGVNLVNNVWLDHRRANNTAAPRLTSSATSTVAEPVITTTKSVAPTSGVNSGDSLIYTVRFTNSGTSTAFDMTAEDTLAPGVAFGALSPANQCTFFNGTSTAAIAAAASESSGVVTFSNAAGAWDIPATATDAYVECVYTATAQSSLYLDDSHVNTIDADWYSLNGGTGRNYNDSVSRPGVDGTQDTDTASFTSGAPTIAKDDAGVTQVVIGNTITFTLTIGGPTGTLRAAVVTDHLPAGLIYNNDALITGLPTVSPTVSSPNDGSAPVTLTWAFGDAVKSAANATIVYSAEVADVTSNAVGTDLINNVWLDHHYGDDTAAPRLTDSAASTVAEPVITTTKSVTPTTGIEAGGSLTYTVRFTNTGNAIAHDVVAEDTLPAGFLYDSLTFCVDQASTAVPSQANQVGAVLTLQGNPAGSWDIAAGDYIECEYVVEVQSSVTLDGDYTNTVDADWTSQDGGGRSYDDSVNRPGVDGTQDTDTAMVTSTGATISKDDGSVTQEVIGGKVHVTLTIDSPLGTLQDALVVDTLPAGLIYDAGSQTVSAGIGAATFTASTPNDGSAAVTLTWDFGTTTVVSASPVTIEYDAIVANVNGNADGTNLVNDVELTFTSQGGTPRSSTDSDEFDLAEPVLTIDKEIFAIDVTPDGGDTVTYRVTLAPDAVSSHATAYDIHFVDALPASVTLVPASVSVTLNGGALGVTNNNPTSTTTLDLSIDSIPNTAGASVVITYNVTLNQSVTPAQLIANIADITWTSTPGTNPDERDGTDGPGGTLDDYAARDEDTTFNIADPLFSKSIDLTSAVHTIDPSVAVGEVITFALSITLPEGTTPSLHIPDDLPAGLQFVIGSTVVDTTGFAGTVGAVTITPIAPPVGSGDDLDINIGSTVVTADNNDSNNTFIIRFQAIVLDEAGNQDGTALINSAYLEAGSATPTAPSTAQADVVEPVLEIAKSADVANPVLGETIQYTLVVNHDASSNATAFDVVISDTLDAVFVNPTNLNIVQAPLACATGVDTTNTTGQLVDVRVATLPLGCQLTITFDTELATPAPTIGSTLPNTTTVTWTSLPGPDANERTGAGGVDDHLASDSEDITFFNVDLSVSKDDGIVTAATAGSTITYTITYGNSGSLDATGVVISETVPVNTTFNAAASTAGWTCADGAAAGTACDLNIPLIAATTTGLTVDFAVDVVDPLPNGIIEIDNHVEISDDGTHGDEPTPADNEDDTTTSVDAAPDIAVQKSNGVSAVTPGSLLIYDIVVSNNGQQDAVGITVTETVPDNTMFTAASSSAGWTGCADGDPAGTVCEYAIATLDGYTTAPAIQFAVTVDANPPTGTASISNTVQAADDGTNGPDTDTDNNEDTDVDALVTLPNVDLTKIIVADTPGANTVTPNAVIGEVFTYEVVFNVPSGTMDNLQLTDTLDAGLAFVGCDSIVSDTSPSNLSYVIGAAASSTDLTAVCAAAAVSDVPDAADPAYAPDTSPGREMVLDFGSLTNGGAAEHLIIRYRVVVLDVVGNQNGDEHTNTAVWTWDGALPIETTATPIHILEPDLGLEKEVSVPVAPQGSIVTYTLTVSQLSATSTMDAFDVVLTDTVPVGMIYVPGTLQIVSGPAGTFDDSDPTSLVVEWPVFPLTTAGQFTTAVVEFQAQVGVFPRSHDTVTNIANVAWSSLPGDISGPLSPYNAPYSHERYYDPASPADIYGVSAQVDLSLPDELPKTGFAPGQVTPLAEQPEDQRYDSMGMSLSIPSLGVWSQIVGVPYGTDNWDLTWLNGQVGYLEGTAFPTWTGNTGLTAHVYRADGLPGPFINLDKLKWGDKIVVEAFGEKYIYEVREVYWTRPNDLRPLRHEEKPWLTLITCHGYEEYSNSYRWRTVVRAVQVSIETD